MASHGGTDVARVLVEALRCRARTLYSNVQILAQRLNVQHGWRVVHQLPQSNFGKAINYTLERWDALNLYLEYGTLEIDNNLVENAIRPTAIGKKNVLFFGSPESGQTSAVIYSLIAEAKRR